MAESDRESLTSLPARLRGQFEAVERHLWRIETAAAVCAMAASLLCSWLLFFISDRFWDTPIWLRVTIFLAGLTGATAAAMTWARHWIWQRRDTRDLAALVQKKYRRLGDRLLGIVELAREQKHSANYSPELYQAAFAQVAEEADKFDFRQSVPVRPARRLGWGAGLLGAAMLALCLTVPRAGWNSLQRWLAPAGGPPRYTLVSLAGLPPQLIVPHGEPFAVIGEVEYHSFWRPGRALARIGMESELESPVQSNRIILRLPAQLEKGVLRVRVGDAEARVQILPSQRPSLEGLTALVHLPDYLGYADFSEPVQNGSLRVLEGSRLRLSGTVSRPLAFAEMRGPSNTIPLEVRGPVFSSDDNISAGSGPVFFNWRDELGLTNAAPWRLALRAQPDNPPTPDLPGMPRASIMLASDVIHIRATAQDDYGVRTLGLNWDVDTDGPAAGGSATEARFEMATRQELKVEREFDWSPALYGVPSDSTVELHAFATDYLPGRARARTANYVIKVVSPEEHAELLRQEFEGLMAQVEDVTRLQEKIVSDTRAVQQAGTNMPASQAATQLNQSHDEQLQNAQQLGALAKAGEDTVREAMKNPQIPADTVNQWAKTMAQWENLAQEKMQAAARSMQDAAQSAPGSPPEQSPSSSPSSPSSPSSASPTSATPSPSSAASQPPGQKTPSTASSGSSSSSPPKPNEDHPDASPPAKQSQEEVDEALQRAQEILEALRKMEQSANKNLDQMQALTLAARLRKLGQNETNLDGELMTNFADTLGLSPSELPEKFRLVNLGFARQQEGVHDETANLQGEIARFFERTQKTNYGTVNEEMKQTRAVDEMDRMSTLLESNITAVTSLDLTNWAGHFAKWAEDLTPKPANGGGGDGKSGPSQDLGPLLTALLRLREREVTLHEQTTLLEGAKNNLPDYSLRAVPLANDQAGLSDILTEVRHGSPLPQLDPLFAQTGAAMQQSHEFLAQPATGEPTQAAERKAVDTLSDIINLINEAAQQAQAQSKPQPGQGTTSAEQMAFLTQLMSQPSTVPSQALSPGGNLGGGGTDRAGHAVSGNVSGPGAESRRVGRAAGSIESYPAEFRDALENYFHAVESASPEVRP